MKKAMVKLSYLWFFVLFNIIFRDLHEMPTKEFLSEALTGAVNGVVLTEPLMLFGAIVAELTISMILVARFMHYKWNRILNMVVGALIIVFFIATPITDIDDAFFTVVKIGALGYIIWYAWRWKESSNEGVYEQ